MNRVLISMQDGLEEPAWFGNIEEYELKVLERLGYDGQELSILFCDDSFIKELNKNYRDMDNPTDILSFENGEEYEDEDGCHWISAGDIIISLDTLPKNAAYFSVTENEELKRLLIHGTLQSMPYMVSILLQQELQNPLLSKLSNRRKEQLVLQINQFQFPL